MIARGFTALDLCDLTFCEFKDNEITCRGQASAKIDPDSV